jgi:hypothetical protein
MDQHPQRHKDHPHYHQRPSISTPDYADEVAPKDVCRFLHNLERENSAKSLRDLRDQGKVTRSLTNDKFGNGSNWHFTGLNMRFKDWRFNHRARLNCLPITSVKQRWSDTSPTGRHCEQDETLPHVLCHCTANMQSPTYTIILLTASPTLSAMAPFPPTR